MKIKDLFKQMEKANEFAKMVGGKEWKIEVAFDEFWYSAESFSNYKDFSKWLKKEYLKEFGEIALDTEITLDRASGKGNFVVRYWWLEQFGKGEEKHSIDILIYKE